MAAVSDTNQERTSQVAVQGIPPSVTATAPVTMLSRIELFLVFIRKTSMKGSTACIRLLHPESHSDILEPYPSRN